MTTLGVGEIIAIAIASVALLYQVGKDALKSVKKEASYLNNLKENYEALQWELNFLLDFKSGIERKIRRRRGNYGEIYNRWSIHVHEFEEKAKSRLEKYEHIRKCNAVRRSRLSRQMVRLCKKVIELKGEGKDLARLLGGNRDLRLPPCNELQQSNRGWTLQLKIIITAIVGAILVMILFYFVHVNK